MKRLALLCLATAFLAAQAVAPEVEITAEPHHHLAFENNSVRVFNVEVAPNADTPMHWHRHDYIFVTLGATEVVNAVKDKPPVTLKLQDGETRFSSAAFAHVARNLSDHPFRNVTIEILQDSTLRNQTSPWISAKDPARSQNEDRGLETFPGGTRQILFVKDAIRVSETELQPGGVIPMHHHAGPHLLVAVSDLDLRSDEKGKAPQPVHLKASESKWVTGNYNHTVTNTGTKAAKLVTLEFP